MSGRAFERKGTGPPGLSMIRKSGYRFSEKIMLRRIIPKDASVGSAEYGVVSAIKQTKFALNLVKHGKVPPPFPPHVAKDVNEARNLRKLVREQDRQGALGHVQGEHALAKLDHGHADETLEEIYDRPGAAPRPWLPEAEEEAKT